jgi:hypothetical protein
MTEGCLLPWRAKIIDVWWRIFLPQRVALFAAPPKRFGFLSRVGGWNEDHKGSISSRLSFFRFTCRVFCLQD